MAVITLTAPGRAAPPENEAQQKAWARAGLAALATEGDVAGARYLLRERRTDPNAKDENGTPTLCAAAALGNLPLVRLLLDAGADVNARDPSGRSALMNALYTPNGDFDLVARLLLERGAPAKEKDGDGFSVLHHALLAHARFTVRALLEHGADIRAATPHGETPLPMAVSRLGGGDVVRWFARHGADIKGQAGTDALLTAANQGDTEAAMALLDAGANVNAVRVYPDGFVSSTALNTAVRAGQPAMVRLLLARGAPANSRDGSGNNPAFQETALQLAAGRGFGEIVQILLDAGADVNARGGADGSTALMDAAARGNSAAARLLLDRGADVNAHAARTEVIYDYPYNPGANALIYAAGNGHDALIALLLDRGAAVNDRDRCGLTALMYAVRAPTPLTLKLLLDRGADGNAQDQSGLSALSRASAAGEPYRVRLLLRRGGARVDARDRFGETALFMAAFYSHNETRPGERPSRVLRPPGSYLTVVRLLLGAEADPNARRATGETLLATAAGRGSEAIVRVLLEAGANPNVRGNEGNVALRAASRPSPPGSGRRERAR